MTPLSLPELFAFSEVPAAVPETFTTDSRVEAPGSHETVVGGHTAPGFQIAHEARTPRFVLTEKGAVTANAATAPDEHAATGAPRLRFVSAAELPASLGPHVLLGDSDGNPVYAAEILEPMTGSATQATAKHTASTSSTTASTQPSPRTPLLDLRTVAPALPSNERRLATRAVAMGTWHRETRYCPRCAGPLTPSSHGWVLRCTAEGVNQFPRTDPAVIMAVRDRDDRLLLARNAARPQFLSVLAGFVEPGETAEAAVAREVHEESGVQVDTVEYVGSQPWPFPRSLMLAYRAFAHAPADITLHDGELREARWFSRSEFRAAVHRGEVTVPGAASMGHALIKDWYGAEFPEGATR